MNPGPVQTSVPHCSRWTAVLARWRRPDAEHPAAGDGERLHPGLIAQPVNTVSSAAYLLAAARIRPGTGASATGTAMCLALAANGLGSMGFHGPGDRFSHALHNLSLAALVAIAATDIGTVIGRRPAVLTRLVGPMSLLGIGALINTRSRTGGTWCRPDALLQGHALWHLISAAALSVLPGRTSRPEPARVGK